MDLEMRLPTNRVCCISCFLWVCISDRFCPQVLHTSFRELNGWNGIFEQSLADTATADNERAVVQINNLVYEILVLSHIDLSSNNNDRLDCDHWRQ